MIYRKNLDLRSEFFFFTYRFRLKKFLKCCIIMLKRVITSIKESIISLEASVIPIFLPSKAFSSKKCRKLCEIA